MSKGKELRQAIDEYQRRSDAHNQWIKKYSQLITDLEDELEELTKKNTVKHGDVFIYPPTGEVYLVTFQDKQIFSTAKMSLDESSNKHLWLKHTDSIQQMFDEGRWNKVGNVFEDYAGK